MNQNTESTKTSNSSLRAVLYATILLMAAGQVGAQPVSPAGPATAKSSAVEQEIKAMETQLEQAIRTRDIAKLRSLYDVRMSDIHSSGWIYTRDEFLTLLENVAKQPKSQPQVVIKAATTDVKITVLREDLAFVTDKSETYFAEPDPQEVARAAGTMLRGPGGASSLGYAPGEAALPNPWRYREARVWMKEGGVWKVVLGSASEIRERGGEPRKK